MERITRTLFMAYLVLAFLVLGGLGNLAMAEKDVLRIGRGPTINNLDPQNHTSTSDITVTRLVYDNLVDFDREMNIVPDLATSWEKIDDTTWRFKLRKGVKFHDGTPFNSRAAKMNIDRLRTTVRIKYAFGMIESATIEDDYTILVKTDRPFGPFLRHLCFGAAGVVSPKAIETYGKELVRHAVGTGPFKFKEWLPRQRCVLVRNENYWGEKVKLKEVRFIPIPEEGARAMAFESGDIDVIEDPLTTRIPKYKANKKISVLSVPSPRIVFVGFNCGDKVLSNVKLRKAIAHTINRGALVEHVLEGNAMDAQTVFSPIFHKSKKKYNFDYDFPKAKKLLKEAGYPEGLELRFWTCQGHYPKDQQIAEAIQGQLPKVGIRTKLQVMEWGSYMSALTRLESQMFIMGWGFASCDPESFRGYIYSGGKFAWCAYNNPTMDALFDKGVSIVDPEKRRDIYEQVQQQLIDDAVLVPIYVKNNICALHDNVKNFFIHPLERLDLKSATVE